MSFNINKLEDQLIAHEGLRLKPYTDTVGKLTIGVGHNLTDRGITREQAMSMLLEDIQDVEAALDVNMPWWKDLDEVRGRALMDLCFNLGISKLLTFTHMLEALKVHDWTEASNQLLASLYAKEVGKRATDLAFMFQTGKDSV